MRTKLGLWDDEEVKTLFRFVEVKKSEGVPLIKIFNDFANCTGRHQNSVRNYYYKEIRMLTHDKDRLKRLKINLNEHFAKKPQPFLDSDTKEMVEDINNLVANGYSVRGACLKLAEGDATKMIRFQNKYRAETKNKRNVEMGNVIKMPINHSIMSDEDINALFLGLIKLVKRQEMEKAKTYVQIELENSNERLKKALKEIVLKKAEIEKLQSQIVLLKQENCKIKEKEVLRAVQSIQRKNAKELIGEFVSRGADSEILKI